jgi:alkaline phosphatase D
VLAQQGLMAELNRGQDGLDAHWSDGWDGYAANRDRILRFIAERKIANPIVLGGDIHSFWTTDLKLDFKDVRSSIVATEFVGTSISSAGLAYERMRAVLPRNPHIKFFDSRARGYARCELTQRQWRTDFQAVEHVRSRDAAASTLASFIVESGTPGAQRA